MARTLTLTAKQASKLLTIATTLSELGSDSTVVRFARNADSWEAEITPDGSLRVNKYEGDKYIGCEYHDSHHDFATAYSSVN